ncbi:SPOCS domain-containing protein [Desulfofundulus sp.]|uniref:SPOCS domain-containing protein n=1 Tax=Desulfofundulus sp. TaxID=2282750 RepID=UPI003C750C66
MVGTAATATERLRVNQVVSEDTQQVVVRGKITVPDPKPDVQKILSTDKSAKIKKTELIPDKAIVEGTLTLQIVYVAFDPSQSVHHMHQQLSFSGYVELPGARPGMDVTARVTVEDVSITRTSGDPRQFDVTAVLSVFVKVTEMRDVDVVTSCPAGATCEMETIKVANVVGSGTRQVIVSEDFEVPGEKPPVAKILEVDATAEITGKKTIKDKAVIEGTVTVQVLYVAAEPDQPVHQLHHTFRFSDVVEIPGAKPDMDVRVDVRVESADVEIVDGNKLRADVVLKLTAFATEPKQVNVITKISGVQATMTKLKIDHVVGEDSTQVVLRDTFETPDPKPDVEKIIDVTVQEVKVTETKIISDKVIVRGYVDVNVVYVAKKPDQTVHALERRLHFRTFVEVKGAREGMDVDVRPVVEYVSADAEGPNVILEVVLKVTVKVTESLQRDVVISVAPAPSVICPPGETIDYVVQPGDTFWKIAQKFGTTVSAIENANPCKDPQNLQPGDVIKVPCPPAKG